LITIDKTKHAFELQNNETEIVWFFFCLPYQWRARSHKYKHTCIKYIIQKQTKQKQWGRHFGYSIKAQLLKVTAAVTVRYSAVKQKQKKQERLKKSQNKLNLKKCNQVCRQQKNNKFK